MRRRGCCAIASLAIVCFAITYAALARPSAVADELWFDPESAEDSAPELGPDVDMRPSRVRYLQADTLMLGYWRAATNQPIVIRTSDENNVYPGPTLITTNDAMLGLQAGPQITLGVADEFGDGWETRYFSLLGGRQRAVATGDNDVALTGGLGQGSIDFFGVEQIAVESTGDLHSIEVNRFREWGGFTWLAGVRYLRLSDRLTITSDDSETNTFAQYDLRTANNLFGAQLGLRRSGEVGRLRWQVDAKAGLYGNSATHNQAVVDFPNPLPPFFLREWCPRSRGNAAFIGELEFGCAYAITANWSARAGYRMLWVEGVGLSADQLDFRNVTALDVAFSTAGGVFMHGASVGLELNW